MNKLTSRERVLRALALKEVDRIPWIELGFHTEIVKEIIGEEIILSTGFHPLENPLDYKKYLIQMIKLAKKIGLSGLILKRLGIASAFTETISVPDSIVYKTKGKVKDKESLREGMEKAYGMIDATKERVLQCAEVFDEVMKKEDLARGITIGGCFMEGQLSMGLDGFSLALYEDPDLVKELLDFYVNFNIDLIKATKSKMELDFVWMDDDIAFKSSTFLSPDMLREFIFPRYARIKKEAIGDTPWILHSDGNILPVIEDLIALGIKGLHPMEPLAVDIFKIKEEYGNRICPIGNLDVDLFERGTPEEVEKEAKRLTENLGHKGYIFSSGNSITEWAKVENVLTVSKILKTSYKVQGI